MGKKDKRKQANVVCFEDMPLAQAIVNRDVGAIKELLHDNIKAVDTEELQVSKTVGEAFTGGRSTPVYELKLGEGKYMIAKVVEIRDITQDRGKMITQSYICEGGFYKVASRFIEKRLAAPRLLRFESNPKHGQFMFLMNDLRLDYPLHPETLSVDQVKLALDWVVSFHKEYQVRPKLKERLLREENCVGWSSGTFWNLSKLRGSVDTIASTYSQTVRFLAKKHPSALAEHGIKELGNRLRRCVRVLNVRVHPTENVDALVDNPSDRRMLSSLQKARQRHVTVIHGDLKAANLFFNETTCAGVDFQFYGLGLGVVDVCYLLFPDARADYSELESSLLEYYHEKLDDTTGYSLDMLRLDYDLAQVSFLCYSLTRGWVATSANDVRLLQKN
mmetsp:Transcript_20687/g.45179  ORF Transcript_20687/g.45179 Transcript_20687/m.45179 type:complete len:389 (+) Transcript_20687:610-1776(+)